MSRDDARVQRWLFLGLVLSTTAAAATRLLAVFRFDQISLLDVLLLAVFAILFVWIATSFWIGCLGAHSLWRGTGQSHSVSAPVSTSVLPFSASSSRTALVMPIFNEDVAHVSAHLQAMLDSLREDGLVDRFDVFMLSDSNDPNRWAAEVGSWRDLRTTNKDARIYYRRRDRNTGHKSGNIAAFCQDWGALYDYMIILDADSLMTGQALGRLVNMMDANPRVALIQAPPLLVGGESLFARMQQFASWVYGPVYVEGLSRLAGEDSNYWGHNAIIRVKPFMENCGLPLLPGRPPLGGEILSHDFVEAALLRRAGWEVRLAPEVLGSFEASPPTLIDYLKRDRRWCQGNLQHVKLIFAQGLRTPSRLHFALGAMSYLASPLWLFAVVLFCAHALRLQYAVPVTYHGRYPVLSWPISHSVALVSIVAATLAMLFVPKILSIIVLLRNEPGAGRYGGRRRLIGGFLIESALSVLLAPIFMLSHSWFVANILVGRTTQWGTQPRGSAGVSFRRALVLFAPHTLVALIVGFALWLSLPGGFWWCLPLLLGPAMAAMLTWLTSNPSLGLRARRRGLFLVPSETQGLAILERVEILLRGRGADPSVAQANQKNLAA
jgi:membrane glycosyltransferase